MNSVCMCSLSNEKLAVVCDAMNDRLSDKKIKRTVGRKKSTLIGWILWPSGGPFNGKDIRFEASQCDDSVYNFVGR